MDLAAIALQGIGQAETQLEAAAAGIASAEAQSSDAAAVDLSSEVVALLAARNQNSIGVATLKIADQVQKTAVDLLA